VCRLVPATLSFTSVRWFTLFLVKFLLCNFFPIVPCAFRRVNLSFVRPVRVPIISAWRNWRLRGRIASDRTSDHGDDKQNDKDKEQYFSYTNSRAGDTSETQQACDDGNYQKCNSPTQHIAILLRQLVSNDSLSFVIIIAKFMPDSKVP
tara:strand:- start:169 stop:615 length:447 start_codon:yes stop_codon:yes gene_type:complete